MAKHSFLLEISKFGVQNVVKRNSHKLPVVNVFVDRVKAEPVVVAVYLEDPGFLYQEGLARQ